MSAPSRQSALQASIAAYRERLLALDSAALAMLQASWETSQTQIIGMITALTEEIAERGTMTTGQAMRLARAERLLQMIQEETARLAETASQVIPQAQQAAISQAIERARVLAAMQAPNQAAQAAVAREWTAINPRAMENLVGALSDGSPLDDWLRQLAPDAVQAARDVLTDGVARGVNPRDIGRSLERVTGMPLNRATMLSRNETMRAYRAAGVESMRANADVLAGENGMWEWSAALDGRGRTCAACTAMSGRRFSLDVEFSPFHISCRCSQIPVLDDPDGLLPDIETGHQWFDRQPVSVQEQFFPVGLRDEFRAGKITLDDMATLHTDPTWGDSYRVSTMSEARTAAAKRRSGNRAAAD